MKKLLLTPFLLISFFNSTAQGNVDELLAAGLDDAKRYTSSYLTPAFDGALYSITGGWFNSAAVNTPLRFTFSLSGNAAIVDRERRSFLLRTAEYEFLQLRDGSTSKNVATLFGDHPEDIIAFVEVDNGFGGTEEVEIVLPTGITNSEINIVPSVFIQGSMGLPLGTEVKVRFIPTIDYQGTKINLYGIGLQHEMTSWLVPKDKRAVAVSGLIAYTHLNGSYNFTDTGIVEGDNQRFETRMNTWLFQLIASTKISLLNLYGGIGYVEGKSQTDLKGTYIINQGVLQGTSIIDPYGLQTTISGVRGTFGVAITLGILRIHADYTLAAYDNLSAGIHFSFK